MRDLEPPGSVAVVYPIAKWTGYHPAPSARSQRRMVDHVYLLEFAELVASGAMPSLEQLISLVLNREPFFRRDRGLPTPTPATCWREW